MYVSVIEVGSLMGYGVCINGWVDERDKVMGKGVNE